MKQSNSKKRGGFITVEYLLSFFLVMGLSMVIISFSATLSMVEVAQYIAFAAARNYFAANIDQPTQAKMAETKLASLLSATLIRPLASGSWFTIDGSKAVIGDGENFPQYSQNVPANRNLFEGVLLPFTSNVLAMQIPFFGSTVKSGQTAATAFTTNITAFVGREPSFQETNQFNQQRWTAIQALSSNYSKVGSACQKQPCYLVFTDNGG